MWRPRTIPVVVLAALALAGCGSTVQEDTVLRIYAGPTLDPDTVGGARAALEEAGGEAGGARIELVVPTGQASEWVQADVGRAARAATQDSTSMAYIGDAGPEATSVSAPITNEAGLLQIAPTPLPESLLTEPGGNDVPSDVQTTGERTLGAIPESGNPDGLGYQAMSLILDAIDSAEDPLDRADVIAAYMATASPIGVASPPDG
jgi:hypothetical protein